MSLVGQVQGWVRDHLESLVERIQKLEDRLKQVEEYIQAVERTDHVPNDPAPRSAVKSGPQGVGRARVNRAKAAPASQPAADESAAG